MEANKDIFKAGDRIFHIQYGWGTIKDVIDDGVMIYFDDYSVNRVSLFNKHIKLLSFTEYTLKGFSQERPKELPKPGDIVWVRDSEYDNWMITYFRKYAIDRELKYGTNPRNSGSSQDCYFYRYLTTENPYK